MRTPFLTSQKPFDLLVSYELFPLEHISKVCCVFSVVVLRREAVHVPLAQLSEEVRSLRWAGQTSQYASEKHEQVPVCCLRHCTCTHTHIVYRHTDDETLSIIMKTCQSVNYSGDCTTLSKHPCKKQMLLNAYKYALILEFCHIVFDMGTLSGLFWIISFCT